MVDPRVLAVVVVIVVSVVVIVYWYRKATYGTHRTSSS